MPVQQKAPATCGLVEKRVRPEHLGCSGWSLWVGKVNVPSARLPGLGGRVSDWRCSVHLSTFLDVTVPSNQPRFQTGG
jgi:hypothetical protein